MTHIYIIPYISRLVNNTSFLQYLLDKRFYICYCGAMEISYLGKNIECKPLDIKHNHVRVYIDLEFEEDRKMYHILECGIDCYDYNPEADCDCGYGFVTFEMNECDDLTDAIVGFLANYHLYLHHYTVLSERNFVSYSRLEDQYSKNLQYSPICSTKNILVKAKVQKEDGVDYKKILDLRIEGTPDTLTKKQVCDLGYNIDDIGIYAFVIVSDDEMPDWLVLDKNPGLLYSYGYTVHS